MPQPTIVGVTLLALTSFASGYMPQHQHRTFNKPRSTKASTSVDRRTALLTPIVPYLGSLVALEIATKPTPAAAAAADAPDEFKNVAVQAPAPEGESPFRTLADGVKVKDFRPGSADGAAAAKGSRVSLQMSGRLLNLNGTPFYDTKKNDPEGFGLGTPLTFTIGDGTAIPGLESGVMGMRKNAIRRIIVPPELGYTKYPGLEPIPTNAIDQRALDSVIKNSRRDATLLFDVKLERLK